MPLYNLKPYFPRRKLSTTDNTTNKAEATSKQENLYTIPFTGEQFTSKNEFESHSAWYNKKLWACSATGQSNLTYKEAQRSEENSRKVVKDNFPLPFVKPVLKLVHHSSLGLEVLIDEGLELLKNGLFVGEPVTIQQENCEESDPSHQKIGKQREECMRFGCTATKLLDNSRLEGTIVKVSATNAELPEEKAKAPLYSVTVNGSSTKCIHLLPMSKLERTTKLPTKRLMRLFIRTSATKSSYNVNGIPWIVNENLRSQHGIRNKLASLFVTPAKGIKSPLEAKRTHKMLKKIAEPLEKKDDNTAKSKSGSKKIAILSSRSSLTTSGEDGKVQLLIKTPKVLVDLTKAESTDEESGDAMSSLKSGFSGTGKKLKQASLFDMLKKNSSKPSTSKDPKENGNKVAPPKKPVTLEDLHARKCKNSIHGLLKTKDKMNEPKSLYARYAQEAVHLLSAAQIDQIEDEEVRNDMHRRLERFSRMQKLSLMTEEQKKEFWAEERQKQKQQKLEEKRKANLRFEDMNLKNLQPLPSMSPIELPEGVSFGDVAMVVEFINAYAGLVLSSKGKRVSSKRVIEALGGSESAMADLMEIMLTLLQTLLQDHTSHSYKELGHKLSKLHLTKHNASEICRLSLTGNAYGADEFDFPTGKAFPTSDPPREDSDSDSFDEDSYLEDDDPIDESVLKELGEKDFHELRPNAQLQVLTALIHRILSSYAVAEYIEEKQMAQTEAWHQRVAGMTERNREKQLEKERLKAEVEKALEKDLKKQKKLGVKESDGESEKHAADEATASETDDSKTVDSGLTGDNNEGGVSSNPDLATLVKRRRLIAAQEKEKKDQFDKMTRARREREMEEQRKIMKWEQLERKYEECHSIAQSLYRVQPLGTDRNHARYWFFGALIPGIFVETGWVPEEGTFSILNDVEHSTSDTLDDESKENNSAKDAFQEIEKTFPKFGENRWYLINTVEGFEALLNSLNSQGIRESALKRQLTQRSDEIKKILSDLEKEKESDMVQDNDTDVLVEESSNASTLQESDVAMETIDEKQAKDDSGEGVEEECLKSETEWTEISQDPNECRRAFKDLLLSVELNIRDGGLGGIQDFPEWSETLIKSESVSDLGECLLRCEEGVMPKFVTGILGVALRRKGAAPSRAESRASTNEAAKTEEDENVENAPDHPSKEPEHVKEKPDKVEEKSAPESKETNLTEEGEPVSEDMTKIFDFLTEDKLPGAELWRRAVKGCQTLSRLHVLLGILELSVKWDKSVQFAKCRICHKSTHDSQLLLCDGCNTAFHMFCLRPALTEVPEGEWYCVSCKPASPRKGSRKRNYAEESESEEEEEEEEEEIEHEDKCAMCDDGADDYNELIPCSMCPSVFHKTCHDPPLRNAPRGRWICCQCAGGRRLRGKAKRGNTRASKPVVTSKRKLVIETTTTDGSDSDDSGPENTSERRKKRNKIILESETNAESATESEPDVMTTCSETEDNSGEGNDASTETSDVEEVEEESPKTERSKRRSSRSRGRYGANSPQMELMPGRRQTRGVRVNYRETSNSEIDSEMEGSRSNRSRRSRRGANFEDNAEEAMDAEHLAVYKHCEELFRKITASRLSSSLRKLDKGVLDLTRVEQDLRSYKSLEKFFEDLQSVIANGFKEFKSQERIMNRITEFQVFLMSLKSELEV